MAAQGIGLMDAIRDNTRTTRGKIKFALLLPLILPLVAVVSAVVLGVVTLAMAALNLLTLPIVAFVRYLIVPAATRTAFASAFPMLSAITPGLISAFETTNEAASRYNNMHHTRYNNMHHTNFFDSNDTNAAIAGAAVTLGAGVSSYAPAALAATLTGPVSLAWMGATSLVAGAGMTFGFSLKRAILGGNPLLPAEDENVPAPENPEAAANRLEMV